MYPESNASGNALHHIGVIIPYESEDDDHWVNFAGRKMAEHFGRAAANLGMAGSEIDGVRQVTPVVIVSADTPELTELDLAIVVGVGLQVRDGLHRSGVAILIDDDFLMP